MSRTTTIVLLGLGTALAVFVIASSAQRLGEDDQVSPSSVAAGPQKADLGWRETHGPAGEQLVFTVDSLRITRDGWSARIGLENASSVAWELIPGATPDGTFGLQLFKTGEPDELDDRNRGGTLPAVRSATDYDPELPRVLEPDAKWTGSISAQGALVSESWARVVFGTLIAVGNPPPELGDQVVWITDHSYRLRK